MNDDQLANWLGIGRAKRRAEIMAAITPEERAEYEETAAFEMQIRLWEAGLGPLPPGVIVCRRTGGRHG